MIDDATFVYYYLVLFVVSFVAFPIIVVSAATEPENLQALANLGRELRMWLELPLVIAVCVVLVVLGDWDEA